MFYSRQCSKTNKCNLCLFYLLHVLQNLLSCFRFIFNDVKSNFPYVSLYFMTKFIKVINCILGFVYVWRTKQRHGILTCCDMLWCNVDMEVTRTNSNEARSIIPDKEIPSWHGSLISSLFSMKKEGISTIQMEASYIDLVTRQSPS